MCALLGCIETIELTSALDTLASCCNCNVRRNSRPEIVSEDGAYSWVVVPQNRVRSACAQVISAVRKLIGAYTHAFRVNFALTQEPAALATTTRGKMLDSCAVMDCVSVRVGAVHRADPAWNYDIYELRVELFHGVVSIAHHLLCTGDNGSRSMLFSKRIAFDSLISFESVAICTLPRESRLVLTLYGKRKADTTTDAVYERIELGWTAQNLFSYGATDWMLVQGDRLLAFWPESSDKRAGCVPSAGRHPRGHQCPLLSIELPDMETQVRFPPVESSSACHQAREFSSLDDNTQQTLLDIVNSGSFAKMDAYQREVCHQNSRAPRLIIPFLYYQVIHQDFY